MHKLLSVILLFLGITSFLFAADEKTFSRRFAWRGDEYVYRYTVEVEKSEKRTYHHYLREITTASFLIVSLPAGNYRFRVTPHDILDRPGRSTQWVRFEVRPPRNPADRDKIQEIKIDDYSSSNTTEQKKEDESSPSSRFNSLGISAGTAFTDPFVILTLHGTYAPANNFFIELGCDAGFISAHNDVEIFYSFYPFVNLYYFLPFKNKGGFFAGGGAGYIIGSYQFSHGGKAGLSLFAANITAGFNIADVANISYTFKTNFSGVSHQIAIGYVYRFKQRR